jgi:hypothetical protein
MSVQAENSRSCSFLSSLGYNGSLVIWTVVCLAATKFKPLELSVLGFAVSLAKMSQVMKTAASQHEIMESKTYF